jgi:hypothetical protein
VARSPRHSGGVGDGDAVDDGVAVPRAVPVTVAQLDADALPESEGAPDGLNETDADPVAHADSVRAAEREKDVVPHALAVVPTQDPQGQNQSRQLFYPNGVKQ